MLVFSVDKPLRVRWSASLLGDTKYPIVCLSPLPRISVGSRSEVCIYHMRCCPPHSKMDRRFGSVMAMVFLDDYGLLMPWNPLDIFVQSILVDTWVRNTGNHAED
jgi:hypothetical protein